MPSKLILLCVEFGQVPLSVQQQQQRRQLPSVAVMQQWLAACHVHTCIYVSMCVVSHMRVCVSLCIGVEVARIANMPFINLLPFDVFAPSFWFFFNSSYVLPKLQSAVINKQFDNKRWHTLLFVCCVLKWLAFQLQ